MKSPLVRWALLALLLALLLGGGIFAFFHFFPLSDATPPPSIVPPPKPKVVEAPHLLPPDVVALFRSPNAPRALEHFKSSPAFALLTDPGVVESWKKAGTRPDPDGQTPPAWEGWPKLLEVIGGLSELARGDAFVAVTALRLENETTALDANVVAGLQVKPDDAALNAWLERVKQLDPDLEWKPAPDAAHPYFTATPNTGKPEQILCAAQLNGWLFFGFPAQTFEALLARAAETTPQPDSLADSPLFQEASAGLEKNPDLFTYLNFQPLIPLLQKMVESRPPASGDPIDGAADAPPPPPINLSETLKVFRAMALTTTLSGNDWRDGTRFLSIPDNKFITPALRQPPTGTTSRFASKDALIFAVQNVDFPNLLAQLKEGDPTTAEKVDEFVAMADAILAPAGLTLQNDILNNLGPESTFSLEWAPGSPLPSLLSALQHKNKDNLQKALETLADSAAALGGLLQINSTPVGQDLAYTVSSPLFPIPPLTFYLAPEAVVFSFNLGAPDALASRQGPGLLGSPDFQALRDRLGPPTFKEPVQILYWDARRFYANLHGALGTWLPMLPNFDPATVTLPTPDQVEPFLGRSLWLSGFEGNDTLSTAIHEKVHPIFLLAASIGALAELGDQLPKPKAAQDEDDRFEAEVLEMETTDPFGAMGGLPSDPEEPIFDNIPGQPGEMPAQPQMAEP